MNFMKNDSVSKFVVRLRVQARLCDFGSACDDMIRDHVVLCISNVELKKKLLSDPKLTLGTCLEIAALFEATQQQVSSVGPSAATSTPSEVHGLSSKHSVSKKQQRNFKSSGKSDRARKSESVSASVSVSTSTSTERPCFRCGRAGQVISVVIQVARRVAKPAANVSVVGISLPAAIRSRLHTSHLSQSHCSIPSALVLSPTMC